jgi:hypothetical protein
MDTAHKELTVLMRRGTDSSGESQAGEFAGYIRRSNVNALELLSQCRPWDSGDLGQWNFEGPFYKQPALTC